MTLNSSRVRQALLSCLLLAVLVTGLVVGPAPSGNALDGDKSLYNPGQVRIYEQGAFESMGTLVDRNWVLTTGHAIRADVSRYTFRFGGVDDSQDTEAGLRTFDDIVVHPDVPDLALLHFTTPVPPNTPLAQVATTNPFTPNSRTAVLYGWSEEDLTRAGSTLRYREVQVADTEARKNKEALEEEFPTAYFALGEAIPFVLPRVTSRGDSGGGFFKAGEAVGMNFAVSTYRRVNATGNLYGDHYSATYGIPLWPYAEWIQKTINGEGTSSSSPDSGSSPEHDELRRRRLQEMETEAADAPPLATGPAPITSPAGCDPGDLRCQPDPVTPLAILIGPSTRNGQILTSCAGNDTSDTCTFSDTAYAKDSRPTLRLTDPPRTGIDTTTGRRDVIIWCRTTGTLTTGTPTTTLLRLSFTNTDAAGYPPAYGWWDVNPTSVQPLPDNPDSTIDPDQLTPCAN